MKVLLTTLNSKFIHSNLAIRYLKSFCSVENIEIAEYTINDNINNIISDIYIKKADIIAFSCYIWNIDLTLKIASTLKKANNNLKIILGGPEVSFDCEYYLNQHNYIDFIITGEGEITFELLINKISKNENDFENINGIAFKKDKEIIITKSRDLIENLDIIKFPYELEDIKGKMVYYESSRGCPFNCQYCLSSTIEGVRYFSIERVKRDLKKLIEAGVSQVKFVDRSFNCNKERTKEIFKYLIGLSPNVNFHFEINADLLDEELLEIMKTAPVGLFQFEIGVQSTNEKTINTVSRKMDFSKLSGIVNEINKQRNIHLHLDLIAGLPQEDYDSFIKSFNDVYNLKPQMLQLGFLKLLRGSGLRRNAANYEIIYNDFPPYEVISTNNISYAEILKLKDIEDCLDKYNNSNRFEKSLEYIIKNLFNNNPFKFYEKFSDYWRNNNLFSMSHSSKNLYTILMEFITYNYVQGNSLANELIKFDYLSNFQSYLLPEKIARKEGDLKDKIFEFLKNEENIKKYLPKYINIPPKQIFKTIHVEIFKFDVLNDFNKEKTTILFDYDVKENAIVRSIAYNITDGFV